MCAYVYLYLCVQELSEQEYEQWKEERENAELSAEQRDEKIFQSNCNAEQKLQLLGENFSLTHTHTHTHMRARYIDLSIPLSLSPSLSLPLSISRSHRY